MSPGAWKRQRKSGTVGEAELARQLGDALGAIRMDDETLAIVTRALRESHTDKREYHDKAVAMLQDQLAKIQQRLD